jgi:hypothetical protein
MAAVAWLGLSCLPVPAADLPAMPMQRRPADNVFIQPDATCLAWTDGCRACQRAQSGSPTCSNIGIACQPGKMACTQRDSR